VTTAIIVLVAVNPALLGAGGPATFTDRRLTEARSAPVRRRGAPIDRERLRSPSWKVAAPVARRGARGAVLGRTSTPLLSSGGLRPAKEEPVRHAHRHWIDTAARQLHQADALPRRRAPGRAS
jgi:hypothetical protein